MYLHAPKLKKQNVLFLFRFISLCVIRTRILRLHLLQEQQESWLIIPPCYQTILEATNKTRDQTQIHNVLHPCPVKHTHTVQMLFGFKHTAKFYINAIITSTGIVFTWNLVYGILHGSFRSHIRINRTHIFYKCTCFLCSLHYYPTMFTACLLWFSVRQRQFSASLPMFANKHYPTSLIGRAKSISCAQQGINRQRLNYLLKIFFRYKNTLSFSETLGVIQNHDGFH